MLLLTLISVYAMNAMRSRQAVESMAPSSTGCASRRTTSPAGCGACQLCCPPQGWRAYHQVPNGLAPVPVPRQHAVHERRPCWQPVGQPPSAAGMGQLPLGAMRLPPAEQLAHLQHLAGRSLSAVSVTCGRSGRSDSTGCGCAGHAGSLRAGHQRGGHKPAAPGVLGAQHPGLRSLPPGHLVQGPGRDHPAGHLQLRHQGALLGHHASRLLVCGWQLCSMSTCHWLHMHGHDESLNAAVLIQQGTCRLPITVRQAVHAPEHVMHKLPAM